MIVFYGKSSLKKLAKQLCVLFSAIAILLSPLIATASSPTHPVKKTKPQKASLQKIQRKIDRQESFATRPDVQAFVALMHEKHGFEPHLLTRLFEQIAPNKNVLRAISPAAVPEQQRSWTRYRERFLNERRIKNGVSFWQKFNAPLVRASARFGVSPEIIVAIIGVETEYGANMGKFITLEALASLAFDYPPRANFFIKELEELLLFARENKLAPLTLKGSYAGAIGIPQFMPGSLRNYAVDFDENGQIDLRNSPIDAIGSVGNYLAAHGWTAGEPIATQAYITSDENEVRALIAQGIKPALSVQALRERGVQSAEIAHHEVANAKFESEPKVAPTSLAALIDLVSPDLPTEYWLGFENFYVITRYNRSSFYAMSVFQLAEALREAKAIDESAQ